MHTEESTKVVSEQGTLVIFVTEMIRPSLMWEEIPVGNGFIPGDAYWSAIEFSVESQPKEIYGCHKTVELICMRCERWRFRNVTIMLSPNKQHLKSFSTNPIQYVMTYKSVERLSLSLKE